MLKEFKFNIINDYTEDIVINYYKNKYITKEKILYLIKCYSKLKDTNKFLHITSNLDCILDKKNILCSAGGLGGVLYVTPVDSDLKIHNLGKYIIEKELKMFLNNNNFSRNINSLLICIPNSKVGYVDYLEFGKWYYYIYKKSNKRIDNIQLERHINDITVKIGKIIKLANNIDNIAEIFDLMTSSNTLKIYLFESVLEYLFLFQKDLNSDNINNLIAKNIIYQLCPNLKVKFSLSCFNVNYNDLYRLVENSDQYETKNIKGYLVSRISFFIKKYLVDDIDNMYGHVIFRNFNLRKMLEIEFAKLLWDESNNSNYNVLTYIIPKGEMGILPTYKNNIFICDITNSFCLKREKINAKISEMLIGTGIMRDSSNNKEEENMELPIKVQGVMYSKENDELEYLIIKRCPSDGGFWQGVTGTLDEGECLKECLIREIKEELGISDINSISDLKQTLQWSKKSGFMITEYVYAVELNKRTDVVLSEEHDDYRWCIFEEAYNLLEKENNKNTLKIINEDLLNEK